MKSVSELLARVRDFRNIIDNSDKLENNSLMILASELDNEVILSMIAKMLLTIKDAIDITIEDLEDLEQSESLHEDDITSIASLANELDQSGDESLMKKASVLDEVLNILGTREFLQAKQAQEEQLTKLRDKYLKSQQEKANAQIPREPRVLAAEEVVKKELDDKRYRPLEAPSQTRTCPDHPGAQMARVADYVYQCSLDHKIYDYKEGFSNLKGEHIPGGSVDRQTEFGQLPGFPQMVFDTREGRLQDG